ncbi:MAG: substrate-binding domain-containing protein [Muribaculaceae bacterium]|nr:substrate-binding domain-containing protein [Muribaculaceae bacterium]
MLTLLSSTCHTHHLTRLRNFLLRRLRRLRLPAAGFWLLVFLCLMTGLASCSDRKRVKIGVSQCSYDDWRMKLNEEMYRESLLHENLDLEIRSAYDDPNRQVEDIRHFIDEKVDVIIASPQNLDNLNDILKEARAKGIKVIDFDRMPSEKCYDIFVGADNVQLGRSAGEYLLKHLPRGAKFLEIKGLASSTPAGERSQGFHNALDEDSEAVFVASAEGRWNAADAEHAADSLLRLYPDIDAIFAHNDRMALGASEAARKLGRDSILIAGIDAVAETGIRGVADKKIDVTFMYPTAGKELIDLGLKAAGGATLNDKFILTSIQPIDDSNAAILLELSQSIDDEKVKVGYLKNRVDEFATRQSVQITVIAVILLFTLALATALFYVIKAYWQRKRAQEKLEKMNERLNEATASKLTFFTNVSHDLRTPLTLIAEPLATLTSAPNLTPEQHTLASLAQKNVMILRRLINQILDFRKFENGKLELNLSEVDIRELITEWADAFRALARKRHIDFSISFADQTPTSMAVDSEKLERIFFNLLSNAFKFTPDNGRIAIDVGGNADKLAISISDSGKGIPQKELPRIFERFYQADRVTPYGSGIGLALVKAFTELHAGSIGVTSVLGKGSTFRVEIPVRHIQVPDNPAEINPADVKSYPYPAQDDTRTMAEEVTLELADVSDESSSLPEVSEDNPTVLIIDDNPDIRVLLRHLLAGNYTILEASDGKQGIRIASKYIPDLIICDMMMPEMDGLECCRRLKDEVSTSHIPVLMLTACRLDEQRAEAYEAGADGFISKPFNKDVLLARCASLIANRRRLASSDLMTKKSPLTKESEEKKTAAKAKASNASKNASKSVRRGDPMVIENEFYQRFLEIVDKELGNPDISIEEIGSRLGLSRVQFYRKIKAITNFSPVELIRMRRLKEAYRLLTSSETTVAEVAYSVGFSSPGYFAKCFREQYDELPADLQRRTSKLK